MEQTLARCIICKKLRKTQGGLTYYCQHNGNVIFNTECNHFCKNGFTKIDKQ